MMFTALTAVLLLVGPASSIEVPSLVDSPRSAELRTVDGEPILVREGDVIPGLGEVTSIDEETITVERALSAVEREDRRRRGVFAPDFEQRIYPRDDSPTVFGYERGEAVR